jgi:AI-2 transport protein TqsA
MESTGNTPQSTLTTVSLLVIATILLAIALSYTRSMLIPFVFALFLSYFLAPWVTFFRQKLHFPHWLSVMGSMTLFLAILTFFALILRGSILQMIESFSLYEQKVSVMAQVVVDLAATFDIALDKEYILQRVQTLPIFSYVQSAASTALHFLADFLLILVFLIFLISGHSLGNKKSGIGLEIDAKIRAYILTKVLSNLFTAICVWIIYLTLDLDLSSMFALLCFLLCFIPTLGSLIATLIPLPIAFLQYEEPWQIWAVILFPAIIQIVVGNVIEPKLLGKGLDLHPITILLSLIFWGLIWGVAGMFLAVPITAVLKIVLDKHPLTKNFSEVLAGRSPL